MPVLLRIATLFRSVLRLPYLMIGLLVLAMLFNLTSLGFTHRQMKLTQSMTEVTMKQIGIMADQQDLLDAQTKQIKQLKQRVDRLEDIARLSR